MSIIPTATEHVIDGGAGPDRATRRDARSGAAGTGSSSLSNLRAFPFDKIKIDGSFIKSVNVNEQAAAIVRSVLRFGRALKLPVLAEGVETPAELAFLEGECCNEVQGYLVGRPVSIDGLRHLTQSTNDPEETQNVIPLQSKASAM